MSKFKDNLHLFVENNQGIKKIRDKITPIFEKYPSLKQLLLFTLFSFICFAIEYISYTILALCIPNKEYFTWFIFEYKSDAGGTSGFIAFLISNVLAQAATFLLNRKATFNATNNIAWSASMYAVMVCGIIILNTWLGGIISDECIKSISSYSNMQFDSIKTISGYISKIVGSATSFVISFVMSKFVIMRSFGEYASVEQLLEPDDDIFETQI